METSPRAVQSDWITAMVRLDVVSPGRNSNFNLPRVVVVVVVVVVLPPPSPSTVKLDESFSNMSIPNVNGIRVSDIWGNMRQLEISDLPRHFWTRLNGESWE